MRHFMGLVALLCLSMSAWATDFVVPDQRLEGVNGQVPLGELVDISVSPINAKPANYVSSSYNWIVLESDGKEKNNYREFPGGIFFGSGIEAKKLTVLCLATHLYVVKDGDKVSEISVKTRKMVAIVQIGNPPPLPPIPIPPGPNPNPQPEPVFPNGKYGLSKTVYHSVVTKVNASARVAAKGLATNYTGMASAIAAGTLKDAKEILTKTTVGNQSAISQSGADKTAWQPFFADLQEVVFDLYQKNSIATLEDWQTAWKEIAVGLNSIQ